MENVRIMDAHSGKWIIGIYRSLESIVNRFSKIDFAIIFTLILLFFYTESSLKIDLIIKATAVVGLFFFRITKTFWFWLFVSVILIIGHSLIWYSIDNHKYLITWWTLALSLSFLINEYEWNIEFNGRILIGLCFLFATFWKVITPEYMDGSFFHYLLIGGDSRFIDFSVILTGVNPEVIEMNRNLMNEIKTLPWKEIEYSLESTHRSVIMAHFLTWWTIIIEGVIAISFLVKNGGYLYRYRDYILGVFILSTYTVASVIGFAWLIIAMGISQVDEKFSIQKKLWYLFLFIIMAFFSSSLHDSVNYLIEVV